MYPPLATKEEGIGPAVWLLGLSFIEVASIAAAVELIVGALKCRPPGMRVNIMPLYAWYVLVVGGMILFAFPPLIAGDFLFELERSFDWPFFDPTRGGDPILWQHLFWIFGHPEVYIVFLPSIAIAAMIVPTVASVALFCTVTDRDPPVPPPFEILSLSPCTTRMRSAATPVWSDRNCA